MDNPVALNLLYSQTVCDIERGWILCTKDMKTQLAHFQARLAKQDYIELARSLRYYGYIQFQPCFCDYPVPGTKVLVAIGGQELSLRLISGSVIKEGCFKVTRMRCWRITVTHVSQNRKLMYAKLHNLFFFLICRISSITLPETATAAQ